MKEKGKIARVPKLTMVSLGILSIAIIALFYIIHNNLGLISGLDFGPGQYYYTDLPDWQERFFGKNSITMGTKHPLLFFIGFFIWGFICYKLLKWTENNF